MFVFDPDTEAVALDRNGPRQVHPAPAVAQVIAERRGFRAVLTLARGKSQRSGRVPVFAERPVAGHIRIGGHTLKILDGLIRVNVRCIGKRAGKHRH